jgi:recombination protein RecR
VASLPEPVIALTAALGRLPGIGPRSAERLALHLVQADPSVTRTLADALVSARDRVSTCNTCGALTEAQPCRVCSDPTRASGILCVVERALDVLSLEKSHAHRGRYHVLGGRLSPINGVGPEDLRIDAMETRIQPESITEVILALGSDVEGEATSVYLAKRLAANGVRVTRIAQGLPAGSGLEYADDLTLARALEGRRDMGSIPGPINSATTLPA